MGRLSNKLRGGEGFVSYWCQGCKEMHTIGLEGGPYKSTWSWNKDVEKPVFHPSVLVRTGHFAEHFKPGEDSCWCTYNAEHPDEPAPFKCMVCHTFVGSSNGSTPGMVQFLGDCTHEFAGKLEPLPDLPDWSTK